MEQVLEWVKSGLLFGVFSSVILLLCPNKSYEKHINLIVGLLFVLVMIHPVMTFLNLDGETYITYIQNYIMASENGNELSDGEKELYGDSIRLQLIDTLISAGYPVRDITVFVDDSGRVIHIMMSFSEQINSVLPIETYLRNVFGDEITISYE